ncbi:MAG: hypothetical protein KDB00_10165 [Planctomycetales bacterium]|nr:hypothetical protein [Planctomycetales bacterium]
MIERTLRTFESHEHAEAAARQDDNQLSMQQRFNAFMTLMEPHYAVAGRLQRVYRVDEFPQRTVRDDWGLGVQSVSKSKGDG